MKSHCTSIYYRKIIDRIRTHQTVGLLLTLKEIKFLEDCGSQNKLDDKLRGGNKIYEVITL